MFSVFHITFIKKTQKIPSNLFALDQTFPDFVNRASSVLRNFPTFLALSFSQLSDTLRKGLKFHINE